MRDDYSFKKLLFLFLIYKFLIISFHLFFYRTTTYYYFYSDIVQVIMCTAFLISIFRANAIASIFKKNFISTNDFDLGNAKVIAIFILLTFGFRPLHNMCSYVFYTVAFPETLLQHTINPGEIKYSKIDELVSILFIGPIMEEIEFRLILISILLKKFRPLTSILISSIIFTIPHFDLQSFFFGLSLAYIYLRFGLLSSIVSHSVFNLMYFLISEQDYFSLFQSYPYLTYLGACLYVALLYYCIRYCYLYRTDQYKPLTFLRAGY